MTSFVLNNKNILKIKVGKKKKITYDSFILRAFNNFCNIFEKIFHKTKNWDIYNFFETPFY